MAMIVGKIHVGSGLANQLHTILMTRILALDKGFDYGYVGIENFKGGSFMNMDWGKPTDLKYHIESPSGKLVIDSEHKLFEENTPYYNPEIHFVEDNTVIDGFYQDERYFEHRMGYINRWLSVEPVDVPDDVCVIGFRGGEFYTVPELGLPKSYYDEAIEIMKSRGVKNFEVHTDDEILAQQFFPDFKIIHDIGINWRSVRCAKYAIIANSSFYILPRLLRHFTHVIGTDTIFRPPEGKLVSEWRSPVTIAPRYWDRYNIRKWERPYNYYKAFQYI